MRRPEFRWPANLEHLCPLTNLGTLGKGSKERMRRSFSLTESNL